MKYHDNMLCFVKAAAAAADNFVVADVEISR